MNTGCRLCGKVAHGAVGLAKAVLGVGKAPQAVVAERRNLCRACEHATRNAAPRFAATGGLTSLSRCKLCSCVIIAKTRNAEESCPDGRWGAVPAES